MSIINSTWLLTYESPRTQQWLLTSRCIISFTSCLLYSLLPFLFIPALTDLFKYLFHSNINIHSPVELSILENYYSLFSSLTGSQLRRIHPENASILLVFSFKYFASATYVLMNNDWEVKQNLFLPLLRYITTKHSSSSYS